MINKIFLYLKKIVCIVIDISCFLLNFVASGIKKFVGLVASILK